MVKGMGFKVRLRGSDSLLQLTRGVSVTLGKLLKLSVSQFPYLQNEDNKSDA